MWTAALPTNISFRAEQITNIGLTGFNESVRSLFLQYPIKPYSWKLTHFHKFLNGTDKSF